MIAKTAIDRLGERLKAGEIADADLRMLEEYRRSFGPPYLSVVETVRRELGVEPTGRPSKSTTSIVEKLRRESVRLTQIQDIAGCRIIVADITSQNDAVRILKSAFGDSRTTLVDRRKTPSHGYSAVHLIVQLEGQRVEVQVRTELQHLWAELSESLADSAGQEVKYGGGPPEIKELLATASSNVSVLEASVQELQQDIQELNDSLRHDVEEGLSDDAELNLLVRRVETLNKKIADAQAEWRDELRAELEALILKARNPQSDIPD